MPLIASMTPKALKANIKAEIEAGKPPKQAVAIGYSVQRQAMKDAGKKPTSKKKKRFSQKDLQVKSMAAPQGNQNAAKGRLFYDKLRLVLTTEPHRLRGIAEQLVSQAEAGEPWAIKEIIDRMDGKAIQATTIENADGSPLLGGIQVTFIKPE